MAGLVQKMTSEISTDGTDLWIIDKTGAYAQTTNEGRYGAPNPELLNSCILAVVLYQATSGVVSLTPVGSQFRYQNDATNDEEFEFEFKFVSDGYHKVYLMRLPVSTDGVMTLDGNALLPGDYFYYVPTSLICKLVNNVPVTVTDLTELVELDAIVQSLCMKLFIPKIVIERQRLYREYRRVRKLPEDENTIFDDVKSLTSEIIGMRNAFGSGLTTVAQEDAEYLCDKYNL